MYILCEIMFVESAEFQTFLENLCTLNLYFFFFFFVRLLKYCVD